MRRRHQLNQPRLLSRSQRHRISNPLSSLSIVHFIHRVHPLEAPAWRNAASIALVARPFWNGNKCNCAGIPGSLFLLLLFPNSHAGAGGYDELEYRHVRRDFPVGYGFLHSEGKKSVHTTGEDCQTGHLVGMQELL